MLQRRGVQWEDDSINAYIPAVGHRDRLERVHPSTSVAGYVAAFVLGSVAQGAPFVLVAAALEARGAGPAWLAAIAAARLAPYLVCSPVAGALAGRYRTRSLFAATGLARVAVIVVLWIAITLRSPAAVLVVLLFLLVSLGTPAFPGLMRAVRHVVPPTRLDRSSALAAGSESAAFWAGAPLGGLLLVTGTSQALLVCAAIMAASASVAAVLPTAPASPIESPPARPVRDAAGRLVRPAIRGAIVAVVGVNVLAGLTAALLARLPAELGMGDGRTYGLLALVQGLGTFGAFAVLAGSSARRRRPLVPLVAAGVAVAVLGVASELSVLTVASFALGAAILTAEVLVTGELGRSLPGRLVAPAFGVLDASLVAAMVVGALAAPVLTASIGLRPALAVAGVATPLLAGTALRLAAALDR